MVNLLAKTMFSCGCIRYKEISLSLPSHGHIYELRLQKNPFSQFVFFSYSDHKLTEFIHLKHVQVLLFHCQTYFPLKQTVIKSWMYPLER